MNYQLIFCNDDVFLVYSENGSYLPIVFFEYDKEDEIAEVGVFEFSKEELKLLPEGMIKKSRIKVDNK